MWITRDLTSKNFANFKTLSLFSSDILTWSADSLYSVQ